MGNINVLGADQEKLLELWESARRECDAANALLLVGDHGLGRSVALHLFRGWHGLALMFANKSGLPEPELESFTLERESKLLEPMSSQSLSNWTSSFESIRTAALRVPWHAGAPEPDERHLIRQARILGHCVKAHHPRVAKVPLRSRAWRVSWRKVLTAIAVVVLAVAAFDIGKRLLVSLQRPADAEDTSPTIPQDVYLSLEELSDVKPRGHAWDGPGTVRFMNRLVVSLGGIAHPETLNVSLDGNDGYLISLMAGDEKVGFVDIEPSLTGGLEVYTVTIPEDAFFQGFDSIVIEASAGDGAYALGHLLLDPIDDENPTAAEDPR